MQDIACPRYALGKIAEVENGGVGVIYNLDRYCLRDAAACFRNLKVAGRQTAQDFSSTSTGRGTST